MGTEVGRRIHLVIEQLAGTNPGTAEVLAVVHEMWRLNPCSEGDAASSRLRCATAVAVYFQRCAPGSQWLVVGTEISVGRGVADLVWQDDRGRLVIDELKSGAFAGDASFNTLSMGMSGDYALAVEEGSTLVRVGSLLFGVRGA